MEVVGEWLLQTSFRGTVRIARSRTGRLTVGTVVGLAFGAAWGAYLAGEPTWPRLLWVSLLLSAVSAVLAVGRAGTGDRPARRAGRVSGVFADVAVPPWRWGGERLAGFALINLGIAAAIFGVQAPSRLF
jgi:hypothetical protein